MPRSSTDLTVAAVAERDGRFLIVTELASGRRVLNQPGGHLETGETPEAAVAREVAEETGHRFAAEFLLGVYLWGDDASERQYLRIIYGGRCLDGAPSRVSDPNIVRADWLTLAQIRERAAEHRYPFVMRAFEDYLRGERRSTGALAPYLPLRANIDAVAAHAQRLQ